jgi:hypothetical protein
MSVVIWKDGVSSLCEPKYLANELAAGWSLTKDSEWSEEPIPSENIKVESYTVHLDEESELRGEAKLLGVKSPHNKKIETIKAEIEAIKKGMNANDSD